MRSRGFDLTVQVPHMQIRVISAALARGSALSAKQSSSSADGRELQPSIRNKRVYSIHTHGKSITSCYRFVVVAARSLFLARRRLRAPPSRKIAHRQVRKSQPKEQVRAGGFVRTGRLMRQFQRDAAARCISLLLRRGSNGRLGRCTGIFMAEDNLSILVGSRPAEKFSFSATMTICHALPHVMYSFLPSPHTTHSTNPT